MKLKNKSNRDYNFDKIFLKAKSEMEIEDVNACKVLLNQEGVEEVIDKKEVEKLKKEVEKLKKEVKKQPQKKK